MRRGFGNLNNDNHPTTECGNRMEIRLGEEGVVGEVSEYPAIISASLLQNGRVSPNGPDYRGK